MTPRQAFAKVKKDSASAVKKRIQKLLTSIVRLRDNGCIFRHYKETGLCSGFTAGDHIITRSNSATYADLRNLICACQRHHIYWKPQNPILYSELVKKYVGEKTWNWIIKAQADRRGYNFQIQDWQKLELALKAELDKLTAEKD